MPQDRFFFQGPLQKDAFISLTDQEFRHLTQVMRIRANEVVDIVNGQGEIAKARVTTISKKKVDLQICSIHTKKKPTSHLILAQALPRLNRLDFILEKGTELGMTALWLFASEHSERTSLTSQQQQRMRTVTISALKQCGRLYLPKIEFFPSLSSIQVEKARAFFGDLSEAAPPFLKHQETLPKQDTTVFFIGPEKGFSEGETKWFREKGIHGVKLHHNVLRTDTAALVALTLASHCHFSSKNLT